METELKEEIEYLKNAVADYKNLKKICNDFNMTIEEVIAFKQKKLERLTKEDEY